MWLQELGLLLDIGLGRDHPDRVPVQTPLAQELAHLGRQALDARLLGDSGPRLIDRRGRVVVKGLFQTEAPSDGSGGDGNSVV